MIFYHCETLITPNNLLAKDFSFHWCSCLNTRYYIGAAIVIFKIIFSIFIKILIAQYWLHISVGFLASLTPPLLCSLLEYSTAVFDPHHFSKTLFTLKSNVPEVEFHRKYQNDSEKQPNLWGVPYLKINKSALAGVALWIECRPVNWKVAGSIPSQGTRLGCGPGPQWGAHEKQPYTDVSLPLSLPSPLSKNK